LIDRGMRQTVKGAWTRAASILVTKSRKCAEERFGILLEMAPHQLRGRPGPAKASLGIMPPRCSIESTCSDRLRDQCFSHESALVKKNKGMRDTSPGSGPAWNNCTNSAVARCFWIYTRLRDRTGSDDPPYLSRRVGRSIRRVEPKQHSRVFSASRRCVPVADLNWYSVGAITSHLTPSSANCQYRHSQSARPHNRPAASLPDLASLSAYGSIPRGSESFPGFALHHPAPR
jgi:hypothetical protein